MLYRSATVARMACIRVLQMGQPHDIRREIPRLGRAREL